ncbi:MAG: PIN domain-containing protein [Bacteroidia bacterium]
MRVYIDTSVIGGYFDEEFEEWTIKLFKEFEKRTKIPVVSDLTIQELENAPKHIMTFFESIKTERILLDTESIQLARNYIKEKAITAKSFNDALHIATATVNRLDVLVSWNFKHIVNLDRIRLYNAVNLKNGYPLMEIRTPREILTKNE